MSKFLLTPNGVLWGLKQETLLQNMNTREETRKYNVIKDLEINWLQQSIRNKDGFGPPLANVETRTNETRTIVLIQEVTKMLNRDSDGKSGLGEVLENSSPRLHLKKLVLLEADNRHWIWWWWSRGFKEIRF